MFHAIEKYLCHYKSITKLWITVKTSPSQNVPKSKRPRIGQNVPKNWSKRPNGIKCWSKRPQNCFLLYILCNFRHDLGCSNETVLDKVFYHDSILLFQ